MFLRRLGRLLNSYGEQVRDSALLLIFFTNTPLFEFTGLYG